ncbi:hypothetical protein KAS08_05300 [Candidatus Pacearchaeota archaeon]|nr:hypothetical protein [Candidatus Pacearchaeota archaeon]
MGQILRTKTLPHGKVVVHLELPLEEVIQLKNHAKKVHMFSENLCIHETSVIEKGVNLGSKTVSVPLSLKSRKKTNLLDVSYQKVETDSKTFYIAIARKDLLTDKITSSEFADL